MTERMIKRALRLADRGRYGTAPNPMVGAVVARDGEVVGEGFHAQIGGPHAEVVALEAAGERARGATLYVTLEPCAHHGRTPPCVDRLIAAGIARVVACHADPDPRVRGRGFATLRQAGVEVETGAGAEEALRLNLRYLVRRLLGRPAVTVKWAMSLDGRVATATGESQWISSPPARDWALDLREIHDAILVGVGTVLADDPRLDRRRGKAEGPIARLVLDRRLRTPPEARLFAVDGPITIFTERAEPGRGRELEARGAEIVELSEVTPETVVEVLGRRQIDGLLVEGGPTIASAFVAAGLYDRVLAVVAPLLIGGEGAPAALARGWSRLDAAPRLDGLGVARRRPDVILEGLRAECLPELSRKLAGSSS